MPAKFEMDLSVMSSKSVAIARKFEMERKKIVKTAGVAKAVLIKSVNADKQKEAARTMEEEKDKKSPLDKLKIALFDNLVSNVKAINALNQFETMRVAFCVIISLILLPLSVRTAREVKKKEMNDLFGLNGKSLLLKHCYNKADELERSKLINGGELNLILLEAAILAIQKNTRSDKISEYDRSLAETYWASMCAVSPNKKDVVKLKISPKVMEEHSIHRQYHTDEHIYDEFVKEKGIKMGQTVFIDCKPWYIRKGTADTCLCMTCEGFRLAKQAVTNNMELLNKPYKNRMIIGRFMVAAMKTI
jgi:hypothetical protein